MSEYKKPNADTLNVEIESLSDDDLDSASGGSEEIADNTGTGTCITNSGTGTCKPSAS